MGHLCDDPNICELLLQNKADVHARDVLERTPLHNLHHEDRVDNLEKAKILLKYKADVHATDVFGKTPLHNVRDFETATLLIENGAQLKALDFKQVPALTDIRR